MAGNWLSKLFGARKDKQTPPAKEKPQQSAVSEPTAGRSRGPVTPNASAKAKNAAIRRGPMVQPRADATPTAGQGQAASVELDDGLELVSGATQAQEGPLEAPRSPEDQAEIDSAMAASDRAKAIGEQGDSDGAIKLYDETIGVLSRLMGRLGGIDIAEAHACALLGKAMAVFKKKDHEGVLKVCEEVFELWKHPRYQDPKAKAALQQVPVQVATGFMVANLQDFVTFWNISQQIQQQCAAGRQVIETGECMEQRGEFVKRLATTATIMEWLSQAADKADYWRPILAQTWYWRGQMVRWDWALSGLEDMGKCISLLEQKPLEGNNTGFIPVLIEAKGAWANLAFNVDRDDQRAQAWKYMKEAIAMCKKEVYKGNKQMQALLDSNLQLEEKAKRLRPLR